MYKKNIDHPVLIIDYLVDKAKQHVAASNNIIYKQREQVPRSTKSTIFNIKAMG